MPQIRLDPAHPLLWRDADSAQFGVDGIVRLDAVEPWAERLLHELARGVPDISFDVVAHGCGAPREAARRLRTQLAPVLIAPRPCVTVRLDAAPLLDPWAQLRMIEALADQAVTIDDAADAVPILLLRRGATPAAGAVVHLRDDRVHLPIAFDAGGATAGPLVVPGRTPCLSCRDAADREHDPSWAAVHTQLLTHDPGRIPLARIADAAEIAAELLAEREDAIRNRSSRIVRIGVDGRRASRSVRFHAECRCRSPRGIATAAAPPVPTIATTSPRGYARPA